MCWLTWQVRPAEPKFALGLELLERAEDALVGHMGRILDAMDAEDLDMVGPEALEASFDRGDDARFGPGALKVEPGMDVDPVAAESLEQASDFPFAVAVLIGVRSVDVVDPPLDELIEQPLLGHGASAERDLRDEKSRPAQPPVEHAVLADGGGSGRLRRGPPSGGRQRGGDEGGGPAARAFNRERLFGE